MRISGHREYSVISLTGGTFRACRFLRRGRLFRVAAFGKKTVDPADPAEALRALAKEVGCGDSGCILLTGELAGGAFFRCTSLALPVREQKAALEFELPRHLLTQTGDTRVQFMGYACVDDPGREVLNVCAYPKDSMDKLCSLLAESRLKADEYIHPLLGMKPGDPDLYVRELEEDFLFHEGEWRPVETDSDRANPYWKKEWGKLFILPEKDFDPDEYLTCLLVMRLLRRKTFRARETGVRAIPGKLRPARCRTQLLITVLLLLTLGGWGAWRVALDRWEVYQQFDARRNALTHAKSHTAELKSKLKRAEKEQKELAKILKTPAGEHELVNKLAALSEALPADMLAVYLRYNQDQSLDLTLQTSSENPNLTRDLKSLNWWKVGQMNQRRIDDSVSMLIIKLVPANEGGDREQ